MRRNLWLAGQLSLIVVLLAPLAYARTAKRTATQESENKTRTAPLVLAEQGSFFVNAQQIETNFPTGVGTPPPGHISVYGMYVQYQIPQTRSRTAYPIVMVHGSGHTGKTYEDASCAGSPA